MIPGIRFSVTDMAYQCHRRIPQAPRVAAITAPLTTCAYYGENIKEEFGGTGNLFGLYLVLYTCTISKSPQLEFGGCTYILHVTSNFKYFK